eukprot:TRINITY_DN93896_c0_g1_i1.p1 TRINITY_DN93896_c0_g1~~TRINITY_DN93896_c0_g1_i1.p1  ORF type:complete len:575 (-),score=108.98 TRINITY_DN93896_c0_g1_i1:148-1872(-)
MGGQSGKPAHHGHHGGGVSEALGCAAKPHASAPERTAVPIVRTEPVAPGAAHRLPVVEATMPGHDFAPAVGRGSVPGRRSSADGSSVPEGMTMACQYGGKCYRKNLEHLRQYVHPGDRNYRLGTVFFPVRRGEQIKPEFHTLRDLFNYCDPDESGNISQEEFQAAWLLLSDMPKELLSEEAASLGLQAGGVKKAWAEAAGEGTHMTFAQFASYAVGMLKIKLPVGIDLAEGAPKVCRYEYAGGERCACANYHHDPSAAPNMCVCGHKSSVHHSDVALMSFEEQKVLSRLRERALGRAGTIGGLDAISAPARKPGFTMVTSKVVLGQLQMLLDTTHKPKDNWTRDRGCALHGRNNCDTKCTFNHKAPVPTGFQLVRAEKNRNEPMWNTYTMTRSSMKEECETGPLERYKPLSEFELEGEEPLDVGMNEWRLLHGTKLDACKGICKNNFRLKMAGSGATWKDGDKDSGTPLYGYGVYLAENSTKADEYAEEIHGGLPMDEGCHAMLVCRAMGGLCRVVDTNEFDTNELRRDILDGPFHSVLGDRVSKLNKPYREIVVYDNSQVFPEYILYYKRIYA